MKSEWGIRKIFLVFLLILVTGGIGGFLLERLVVPYLGKWEFFRNLGIFRSGTPVVITKREEIRIEEGVRTVEAVGRVKNSLATVYIHEEPFGSPKFKLPTKLSGVILTSDGLLALPFHPLELEPKALITVLLADGENYLARVLISDNLTGMAFLKIEAKDLPVVKSGKARTLGVGEKLLAIQAADAGEVALKPLVVSQKSEFFAAAGLKTWSFGLLNTFLQTDEDLKEDFLGAVVINKEGLMVGIATQFEKEILILRAEELELLLNNFLEDGKVSWPQLSFSYQIMNPSLSALFDLPKKHGILVKSAPAAFKENDFIFVVNGQELRADQDFQEILLGKKIGEKVKLRIIRSGQEKEIELSL